MGKWKKIIVSGSSPHFESIKIDDLNSNEVVIGGGVNGNLTTRTINGNGPILASTGATNVSISGSFTGDGSGLTNIPASGITGLNLSQISKGDVIAFVDTGTTVFNISSGSTSYLSVNSNGGLEHGTNVTASGIWSHAEGAYTKAIGYSSHAEGDDTQAIGYASHAEGTSTQAIGYASHAEGENTQAIGNYSHAEGLYTKAIGEASHAEGQGTISAGDYSHTEGNKTKTGYVEVVNQTSINNTIELPGDLTSLYPQGKKVVISYGQMITSEEIYTVVSSTFNGTTTTIAFENLNNQTYVREIFSNQDNYGKYSHAEGDNTQSTGYASHAEGWNTIASGSYSHAEGMGSQAIQQGSHAEGGGTKANGLGSHAEGANTIANGNYSHAEGIGTITNINTEGQHAEGKYNINTPDALLVIGNGIDDSNRSNLAEFYTTGITLNQPLTATNFIGDGSLLTGVSASTLSHNIQNGIGIEPFNFNGTSNQTVTIKNSSGLTNNNLTKWDSNDGQFVNSSIYDDGVLVTGSTSIQFTGNDSILSGDFNGKFTGDGSSLTGVTASTLTNLIDNNTDNFILTSTGTGKINGEQNLQFDGSKLTVNGNVEVSGDLSVNGTITSINTENLNIKDKFVLINSGATSLSDSGIVVQYSGNGEGTAIYLESTNTGDYGRWAVAHGVTSGATSADADSYVVTADKQSGPPPSDPLYGGPTNGFGNIYVDSLTGDIWIYS